MLALVARGQSNDEIVATLTISIKTVKTHIGNRLAKLHAQDRAQLVITAYGVGVVARSYIAARYRGLGRPRVAA